MNDILREGISPIDDNNTYRPLSLDDFTGQSKFLKHLKVYIEAAKKRGEPLDHTLFHGPPGLGKTTLARIIANELGVNLKVMSAPAIQKPGDLVATLVTLEPMDVLFIDEIHRLPKIAEESLYGALEDRKISILVGTDTQATPVEIAIQPFTMVAATTQLGLIAQPLNDRFGIKFRLDYYEPQELAKIVRRAAGKMGVQLTDEATQAVAASSRGTPRIALRLLRRVRDFIEVAEIDEADISFVRECLEALGVTADGLDELDRRYLRTLLKTFGGGPAGLEALAVSIAESKDTIESSVEPYLIRCGYITRSPRGRMITDEGREMVQNMTAE